MALRKFNPTTPGQRHKVAITFDEITTSRPEKRLLVKKKRSGGRNDTGKMTIENIGGGHKKRIGGCTPTTATGHAHAGIGRRPAWYQNTYL